MEDTQNEASPHSRKTVDVDETVERICAVIGKSISQIRAGAGGFDKEISRPAGALARILRIDFKMEVADIATIINRDPARTSMLIGQAANSPLIERVREQLKGAVVKPEREKPGPKRSTVRPSPRIKPADRDATALRLIQEIALFVATAGNTSTIAIRSAKDDGRTRTARTVFMAVAYTALKGEAALIAAYCTWDKEDVERARGVVAAALRSEHPDDGSVRSIARSACARFGIQIESLMS